MSKNRKKNLGAALEEIGRLQSKRRSSLVRCIFAIALAVIVAFGKPALEMAGIVDPANIVASAMTFISVVVLAGWAGLSSQSFVKYGKQIEGLRSKYRIPKEELKQK